MSRIETHNGYCFVEVPDGFNDWNIVHGTSAGTHKGMMLQFIAAYPFGGKQYKSLPSGSYIILGIASSLSDKDWEGVVESCEMEQVDFDGKPIPNGQKFVDWYDYGKAKWFVLQSPTESGLSLLESMNLKPGQTIVLKKVN